jgi:hypothetical protein
VGNCCRGVRGSPPSSGEAGNRLARCLCTTRDTNLGMDECGTGRCPQRARRCGRITPFRCTRVTELIHTKRVQRNAAVIGLQAVDVVPFGRGSPRSDHGERYKSAAETDKRGREGPPDSGAGETEVQSRKQRVPGGPERPCVGASEEEAGYGTGRTTNSANEGRRRRRTSARTTDSGNGGVFARRVAASSSTTRPRTRRPRHDDVPRRGPPSNSDDVSGPWSWSGVTTEWRRSFFYQRQKRRAC